MENGAAQSANPFDLGFKSSSSKCSIDESKTKAKKNLELKWTFGGENNGGQNALCFFINVLLKGVMCKNFSLIH